MNDSKEYPEKELQMFRSIPIGSERCTSSSFFVFKMREVFKYALAKEHG